MTHRTTLVRTLPDGEQEEIPVVVGYELETEPDRVEVLSARRVQTPFEMLLRLKLPVSLSPSEESAIAAEIAQQLWEWREAYNPRNR